MNTNNPSSLRGLHDAPFALTFEPDPNIDSYIYTQKVSKFIKILNGDITLTKEGVVGVYLHLPPGTFSIDISNPSTSTYWHVRSKMENMFFTLSIDHSAGFIFDVLTENFHKCFPTIDVKSAMHRHHLIYRLLYDHRFQEDASQCNIEFTAFSELVSDDASRVFAHSYPFMGRFRRRQ